MNPHRSKTKKSHPKCFIIAGPNGAGKTVFAKKCLLSMFDCNDFINADEIALGLSPLNIQAASIQAGRLFLESLQSHIQARRDFAFETTLAGQGYLKKIPLWREEGWIVTLIYLYIPSSEFSADRVKIRVAEGGHNVPRTDIERRYIRSLANLFEFSKICDQVFCLDNSKSEATLIFEQSLNKSPVIIDQERYEKIIAQINSIK